MFHFTEIIFILTELSISHLQSKDVTLKCTIIAEVL